jgi:S-adenosylmethionine:tRNA ribosyltransferase-isomerase
MDSGVKITRGLRLVNSIKQKRRILHVGHHPCGGEFSSSQNTLNPLMDGLIIRFPPHDFAIPTCMITDFTHQIYFIDDGFCIWDLMKKPTLKY